MKRFRVISCAVCLLLIAIALKPCALAAEEAPFSILFTCPETLQSFRFSIGRCGRVSNISVGCRICKGSHFYSSLTFPHAWQETSRTEPTVEVEGAITYTCPSCGTTNTEIIPKLEPVNPDECTHDWQETSRIEPSGTTSGQIIYTCSKCSSTQIEDIPVKPEYNGTFTNWLGSVLGLFNMTLNGIMGFPALRMFAGVLVFLTMFSLLAKLIRQGRRGQL